MVDLHSREVVDGAAQMTFAPLLRQLPLRGLGIYLAPLGAPTLAAGPWEPGFPDGTEAADSQRPSVTAATAWRLVGTLITHGGYRVSSSKTFSI